MVSWLGILMLIFALGMLALAAYAYVSSENARFREKINQHFERVLPRAATISGVTPGTPQSWAHRLLVKGSIYAGFELKKRHLLGIPLLLAFIGLLGWLWLEWTGALLLLGSAVFIFGFLLPYSRLRRRQALITSQIPIFVDQVTRSMGTGRSVESAIRLAVNETAAPLQHVLQRVVRATDLGADMPQTLSEAAKLHGLRELGLISLAMNISNTYGSSPREMLQSVVQMIRQRELAQRELSAMTGETRISAWVLALTPMIVAGYMMTMNPEYLSTMLHDSGGKSVLYLALALQATGVLLLWRLLRSI